MCHILTTIGLENNLWETQPSRKQYLEIYVRCYFQNYISIYLISLITAVKFTTSKKQSNLDKEWLTDRFYLWHERVFRKRSETNTSITRFQSFVKVSKLNNEKSQATANSIMKKVKLLTIQLIKITLFWYFDRVFTSLDLLQSLWYPAICTIMKNK